MSAAPFPIFLVRHGESEWNVARRTQGQTMHPALTVLGREQAREAGLVLAELLGALARAQVAGVPVELAADGAPGDIARVVVWTSDLVRAVQTAETLAAQCAPTVVVEHDKRLREQHLGDLEGCGYEETWAAGEAHDWSDPTLPVAGGESPAQVHERMAEVLAAAREAAEAGPMVLVSHGDAIRVGLAHLAGHGPGQGEWVEVPNGAVFEVQYPGDSMGDPVSAAEVTRRR